MGKTKIKTVGSDSIGVGEEQEAPKVPDVGADLVSARGNVKKEKTSKRLQKKGEPKKRGKKYQDTKAKVDLTQKYSLQDAVKLAQETSYSKFPGTIEAHLNTNVGNIRGLVSLPYFTGKKLIILAFGQDAEKSGADIIGTDETIAQIEANKINFDVLVTTPAWMPKLAKCAKILGPKGLMPNPKNGTITENLSKTIAELQEGKMEYKTEKDGRVIHLAVGKVNQAPEEVSANVKTLFNSIGKSKITKITLSPTMGVGVKVELTSI